MHYLKILVLVLMWSAATVFAAPVQDNNEPLEIGIVPIFNADTVINLFKPLEDYLEKKLKRQVLLVTASDHQTFVRRTQNKEYSVVFTSAHYARLAQKEAGYIPILRAQNPLSGAIVVRKDKDFSQVSALKGKIIAFPNFISMGSFLSRDYLNKQRLLPGRDIQVRYFNSLSSALYAVHAGEADAAATPSFALNFLPAEFRDRLKIIAYTKEELNSMILVHPKLPKHVVSLINQSILDFTTQTSEGKKFIELGSYVSFRKPTQAEMKKLDRFMPELKIMLKQSPSVKN